MQPPIVPLRRIATAALLLLSLFFLSSSSAHNITKILEKHPEFSTFNHYLTITHLAAEINRRTTITVCAVDNAAMASVLPLNTATAKNVLAVHILLDYFGAKKLHQITNGTALAATLFQATGTAPGDAGFVNITDLRGGRVALAPADNDGLDGSARFVKSVDEIPYNISVIHITSIIPSSAASAPVPEPAAVNITAAMSAHGCKAFADALLASEAMSVYEDNVAGGLTVFCPTDEAFKSFAPKFKNLTKSDKASLLEAHALPTYNSIAMLKSGNGVVNTLATDSAEKYEITVQNDGDAVTLRTHGTTARITDTLLNEDPVAIFAINKVLIPKELFKGEAPAPAPAPEAEADAPEPASKHKKKKKAAADEDGDAPADSPADEDPADSTADGNAGVGRVHGLSLAGVVGAALIGFFSV